MSDTPMIDVIPETVEVALAAWDAGESIFTVEMGGIGPGYEMAIQGLAFELMRVFIAARLPPHGVELTEFQRDQIQKLIDGVVHRFNSEPWGGFSGAQVYAATNIAAAVVRRGYRTALRDDVVKDRLIQVNRKDLRTAPVAA
jgi:hypothetical protein